MADVTQAIADAATRYGVDPALAVEVATAESGLNPNTSDSPAGAIGLFQLMPATAAQLGVDPRDPMQNIDGGVRYLRQMLNQFSDVAAALGAYNWGPGAVSNAIAKYGAAWLSHAPGETQNYVARILNGLGTQYTVQAPLLMEFPTSVSAPLPGADASPAAAADSGPSFTTILIMGVVGLFTLWIFEQAT